MNTDNQYEDARKRVEAKINMMAIMLLRDMANQFSAATMESAKLADWHIRSMAQLRRYRK